jgi:hypothetical protein
MIFHLLNEDGLNECARKELKFEKKPGDAYSRFQNQVSLHQGTIVKNGQTKVVSQIVQGTVRLSSTDIGVFLSLRDDSNGNIVLGSMWDGNDLCKQFSYNDNAAI